MKLWKCAIVTLTFCAAALSLFLTRAALRLEPWASHAVILGSSSPQSSSSSSPDSSPPKMDRRARRSTDTFNSLLKEFIHLLQSFTEGELKQIIGTFVERRARRDLLGTGDNERSKPAKGNVRVCSLRHVDISVSDLGLGYVSDEVLRFKYCSGGCRAHRRNYDITLKHIKKAGLLKAANSGKTRYRPCCRPTEYDDDVSFLDNNNKYHTIHNVSASQCGCV